MFKIEKKIPLPNGGKGTPTVYPFGNMKVGDSFLVTSKDKVPHSRVRVAATQYGKRNNKKFITRKVDGGLRVWRVK